MGSVALTTHGSLMSLGMQSFVGEIWSGVVMWDALQKSYHRLTLSWTDKLFQYLMDEKELATGWLHGRV